MKIIILRERCNGLANCIGVAPEVFDLDKEGRAVVLDPLGADDHILLRAAQGCTQKAIVLMDDQGRRVYP
jgi:ferredoxin